MSKLFPVRFLFPPFVSALLRGSCGAPRLRSLCFAFGPVPVLAPPVPVPPEKQLLVLGAAPTRFRVPETDGHYFINIWTPPKSTPSPYTTLFHFCENAHGRTAI